MTHGEQRYRLLKVLVAITSIVMLMGVAGLRSSVLAERSNGAGASGRPPVYSGPGLVYGGPNCPSAPAGFDPMSASADDLQYYGLPARPHGDAAVSDWVDLVHHAQHRVCGLGNPDPHETTSVPNLLKGGSYASSETSNNWAGYVVTDGGFDWAWANWYVPYYTNPSPLNATAVQWVGLGGNNGSNLWQGGTETDDRAGYTFWWEEWPQQNQRFQGPTVHPFDLVRVGVDYGLTCAGESYLQMADYTRNEYWSPGCQSYMPSEATAEWIDERIGCGKDAAGNYKYWALANFQQTNWTYAQAESIYYGNQVEPISYFSNTALTMQDWYYTWETLAYPTGLGSDGKSFTDTWSANGTSTC